MTGSNLLTQAEKTHQQNHMNSARVVETEYESDLGTRMEVTQI